MNSKNQLLSQTNILSSLHNNIDNKNNKEYERIKNFISIHLTSLFNNQVLKTKN